MGAARARAGDGDTGSRRRWCRRRTIGDKPGKARIDPEQGTHRQRQLILAIQVVPRRVPGMHSPAPRAGERAQGREELRPKYQQSLDRLHAHILGRSSLSRGPTHFAVPPPWVPQQWRDSGRKRGWRRSSCHVNNCILDHCLISFSNYRNSQKRTLARFFMQDTNNGRSKIDLVVIRDLF
jgi:hypothetical protein